MTDDGAHEEISATELADLEADAEHYVPLFLQPSAQRKARPRMTDERQLDAAIKRDHDAANARGPQVEDVPDWLKPPAA